MRRNTKFLGAILPALLVVGCGRSNPNSNESIEPKPLEIGDTVKEWKSTDDFDGLPIDTFNNAKNGRGDVEIADDIGHEDECSLYFDVTLGQNNTGYVGTDALTEPYFTEDDAKNGDIISVYFYVPEDSNLASIQLQVLPSSMNNGIKSDPVTGDNLEVGEWNRLVVSYDTLETLGAIGIIYKAVNTSSSVKFYIDDINITLGEETVKTGYESKDESLYKEYEDYFKVGSCMSGSQIKNTEFRRMVKDNFNSITCENEAKPERVLDKSACQKLAREGHPGDVAITTAPFEQIYNWCEANHIKVRHHTFVWYSQTPDWFFNTNYQDNGSKVSKDLMLERMENYIRVSLETINEKWPGLVYAVDVANEAIQNGTTRNSNNNWYSTVGKDFVYYAFKFAHEYKEDYQSLFYNDYEYDYNVNNCKYAVNTLLKQAIEEELIDGIGIQGHIDSDSNMDVLINDAKLAHEKGLECQITELDITINGTSTTALNNQKKAYKKLLTRVLEENEKGTIGITGMIVWGLTDNTSWKSSQNPLLFNSNYAKKPAYYGFLEAVQEFNEAHEEIEEE